MGTCQDPGMPDSRHAFRGAVTYQARVTGQEGGTISKLAPPGGPLMMGPGQRLSGQGAPGDDPLVWLAGRCCDVLEVRVVVEDHRAVVFCHRGGQQVDHSGGPMMTTACHP